MMTTDLLLLMAEAMSVYLLVLGVHALRGAIGLGPFFALLGGLTAITSWVTGAGLSVEVWGLRFMLGSTVFYTALLLGAFIIYVFDGPRAARVAIGTIAGVSVLAPLLAWMLNTHLRMAGHTLWAGLPAPSLRVNAASVLATTADLIFLAVTWEYLGRPGLRLRVWLRALITLLGVLWLDVVLFNTGAFGGTPGWLSTLNGTLLSRLLVALFACPFLYAYLRWQARRPGTALERRPLLAILQDVVGVRSEFRAVQADIEQRLRTEAAATQGPALSEVIIDSLPGAFYIIGAQGSFIGWNAYLRDAVAGRTERQMTGLPVLDVIHPEDRSLVAPCLARVLEHGAEEHIEARLLLRGGPEYGWMLLTGRRMRMRGRPVLIGIGIDITERKRAEEQAARAAADTDRLLAEAAQSRQTLLSLVEDQGKAENLLRESEARYRVFMNSTDDLAYIKDGQYRYRLVNQANVRFFQRTEAEILGRDDYELMPKDAADLCRQSDREALESGRAVLDVERVGERVFEARKFALRLADGSLGVGGLMRDITERERADAAIQVQLGELRRWHDAMLGREARVLELKHEVNALLAEAGQAARYGSAEEEGRDHGAT